MGTADNNTDRRKSSYSGTNGDCVEIVTWRKSTRSGTNGSCVEVGAATRVVLIRDTKDREAGLLAFSANAWEIFTASLK